MAWKLARLTSTSLGFVGSGPGGSSFNRVEGSLRALAVLDERGDAATSVDRAEVEHVGSDDLASVVLGGLHPETNHEASCQHEVFPLLGREYGGVSDKSIVSRAAEKHDVATVDVHLQVAGVEHDTIGKRPGSADHNLECVHTVVIAHLRDGLNGLVGSYSVNLPVLVESTEVVGGDPWDDLLLSKALHNILLLVPLLTDLNVAAFFFDLELELTHRVERVHEVSLDPGPDLFASLVGSCCLYHV